VTEFSTVNASTGEVSILPMTPEERAARGRAARAAAPRSSHAEWTRRVGGERAVELLEQQNSSRLQWLVPTRRTRMIASPFAFFRGGARVMADDLASTPASGLDVQVCGDAHLANFGVYASPERRLVFDVNDFDETFIGPWEWDVKRLVASVTIASRQRGFDSAACQAITMSCVAAYRRSMHSIAARRNLDAWYGTLSDDEIASIARLSKYKNVQRAFDRITTKAMTRDSLRALAKLTEQVDGRPRIRSDPPLLVPLRDVLPERNPEMIEAGVLAAFDAYKETLTNDTRHVLDRFHPIDVALKVVGVGSVGTRCLVLLLEGRDATDPLFLQFKEANASVLEPYVPARGPSQHGQRVVEGQRLMQTNSDIFLGWSTGPEGRSYYGRQLQDWKGSFPVDVATPPEMETYAQLCGWALARAHARSGDAIAIAAYLGTKDTFDRAVTAFAETYASQNELDFSAFRAAIADGALTTG
jgi:uncharacterized protein (DUF2252 family)